MELKSVTGLTVQSDLKALKIDVTNIIDLYKDFVVHADNITEAKQIMADMNKAYKFADDKRKAIKKAYTAELSVFEKDMKEILSALPETRENIKTQLEVYEDQRIRAKTTECNELLETLLDASELTEDFQKLVTLPEGFANVSMSIGSIKKAIDTSIINAVQTETLYSDNCSVLHDTIIELNIDNDLARPLVYVKPPINADFMQLMATASKTAGDRAKSERMAIKAAEDKIIADEAKKTVPPVVIPEVVDSPAVEIIVPTFTNEEITPVGDWVESHSVKMFCDEEKFKEILSWLDIDKIKYEVM